MHPPVAIIGAGRVGAAIGLLLHERGYPILGVMRRTMARAEEAVRLIGAGKPTTDPVEAARGAEVILITVPDGVIRDVAAALGQKLKLDRRHLLVHTSGALPADVLRAPGTEEALHLSMHPIQTIADPRSGAQKLAGATFGLEGQPEAVERGRELVLALGGVPFVVQPGQKALYHAASCVASNYLVALAYASFELYRQAGLPAAEAQKAVEALLRGALENVSHFGVVEALTGPIERGDVETIRHHLSALEEIQDEQVRNRLLNLYRALGLETLQIVAQRRPGLLPGHEEILRLLMPSSDSVFGCRPFQPFRFEE